MLGLGALGGASLIVLAHNFPQVGRHFGKVGHVIASLLHRRCRSRTDELRMQQRFVFRLQPSRWRW